MTIIGHKLLSQNITLLYHQLNINEIDGRKVKKLFDGEVIYTEFPDLHLWVWASDAVIIQVGDRRIRITYQKESETVFNLWEASCRFHHDVVENHLIAYGFNYDLLSILDRPAIPAINNLIAHDFAKIQSVIDGEVIKITPRINYRKNGIVYDMRLEPSSDDKLITNTNVHFALEILPDPDTLHDQFQEQYTQLTRIVNSLVGE